MRYTAFATNEKGGQLADLEVRHRLRARCEDRIRNAKDTGLANLPLHSFAASTLWCHLVMLAAELMAWTQMLAFTGTKARRWEPKKLRARIFEPGSLKPPPRSAVTPAQSPFTWQRKHPRRTCSSRP